MRRFALAALTALALAATSIAPAFALTGELGDEPPHPNSMIDLSCTALNPTTIQLNGLLVGDNETSGHVTLTLLGTNNTWHNTGQFVQIPLAKGQSNYPFSFTVPMNTIYQQYVVQGFDTQSPPVNVDQCGFRVPEAPSSALLLLGAFPALGWFALKAAGVRLPHPHLHRIS
jgi:hypothetical protein